MSDEDQDETLEEKLIEDLEPEVLTPEEIERRKDRELREKKLIQVKFGKGKNTKNEVNLILTESSHGFCNVIKRYLLKNPNVVFASYKKEFYVDPTMFINTEGESALKTLLNASDQLYVDLQDLEKLFDTVVKKFK